MSTYCINVLNVEGSPSDVRDFIERYTIEGALSLARITAPPDEAPSIEWIEENWGTDLIEDYEVLKDTGRKYVSTFSSHFCPPIAATRTVIKQNPKLKIELRAIEDGNAIAYRICGKNGVATEATPKITDRFIASILGTTSEERAAQHQFYEHTANLQWPGFQWPSVTWRRFLLKRRLANYVVYTPPHIGAPLNLTPQQAHENLSHFLDHIEERRAQIIELLGKFGIKFSHSEDCKKQIDQWFFKYGASLYIYNDSGAPFLSHKPLWDGPWKIYNVIFDIGVLLFEWAKRDNPELEWSTHSPIGQFNLKTSERRQYIALHSRRHSHYIDDYVHNIARALAERTFIFRDPMYKYTGPALRYLFSYQLDYIKLLASPKPEDEQPFWEQTHNLSAKYGNGP